MGGRAIPVILDTDIGSDIDDTWALATLLRSPELDLRLVTTATGNAEYRARIAAKMLETAGRADVPVGVGVGRSDEPGATWGQAQAEWVEGYELASYGGTVYEDGVGALVAAIMDSPEPVKLICIGPLPNVAAALRREPQIARRASFVGMHGSIRAGYGGSAKPVAEYNVRADVASCRAAFRAPWRKTITPLDTCGLVRLAGADYLKVRDSQDPLAMAVMENYRCWARRHEQWAVEKESSVLFDTVAVYLAFADDLLEMEPLRVDVTDDGLTVESASGDEMSVATAWRNITAFKHLVADRIAGG